MKRNIDVIKNLKEAVSRYHLAKDKIEEICDIEEWNLEELYENEKEILTPVIDIASEINKSVHMLSTGMTEALEDYQIDVDSFDWCVGKVKDDEIEIVNYLIGFDGIVMGIEYFCNSMCNAYKSLTEFAYDEECIEKMDEDDSKDDEGISEACQHGGVDK